MRFWAQINTYTGYTRKYKEERIETTNLIYLVSTEKKQYISFYPK